MKKWIAFLIALMMMLSAAAFAEDVPTENGTAPEEDMVAKDTAEEEPVAGEWFTVLQGTVFCLALHEDGSFTAGFQSTPEETQEGTWTETDGKIVLDGSANQTFTRMDNALEWDATGFLLYKDAPETYVPAEPAADTSAENYAGYWKCSRVSVGGTVVYADALGDHTDLYIEGTKGILGGDIFGDTPVDLTFENGALSFRSENLSLLLQLQTDGVLRLSLDSDTPLEFYFVPANRLIIARSEEAEDEQTSIQTE